MKIEEKSENSAPSIIQNLIKNWNIVLQLTLVVLVVHLFEIEGDSFFKIIVLTAVGFVINIIIPKSYRIIFFVFLSITGIFWVLGPIDAFFLLTLGMILIGISNLKFRILYRVIILVVFGIVMVVFRNIYIPGFWSLAMWPILGSMFMFRLILYIRSSHSGQNPTGFWHTLAYFFMLPNVAFPLFPVVDFETFKKTYFDSEESKIFEQGQLWIVRGIIHLLIYRLVYYNVLNDPVDVLQLSDLIRYMLGTFLLYLKVSGQFHIIIGIMNLFGFRLPETNNLYYFANSFTDLWRRINIYWKDFMMNTVFYPTYFKLKNLGPKKALIFSTASVFLVTWILHSYQWFWLRGGFPILVQDILFWAILGFLVVRGALKELINVKSTQQKTKIWDFQKGLKTATTFMIFCFLWSFWSTESVSQWIWLLGAATHVDVTGILLFVATFLTIFILGGVEWNSPHSKQLSIFTNLRRPIFRVYTPLVLLIFISQLDKFVKPPETLNNFLQSMYTFRLNAKDAALKHRGYYEQLEVRGNLNTPIAEDLNKLRANWKTPADVGVIRNRSDHLVRDLNPSLQIEWNGNTFTTNRYGMRDKNYSKEKPENTLRIALLGPSHVMGNGVADNETFEYILEERLNTDYRHETYKNFEILNFGVDGYTLVQQLAILEDRVHEFEPDLVIFTQYHQGKTMTESYLLKIILNNINIPYQSMDSLLSKSKLKDIDSGRVPVPFQNLRNVFKWIGLDPRVPQAELEARIRQIAPKINDLAIIKLDEVTKKLKIKSLILVLNEVKDEINSDIPNEQSIKNTDMKILNLLNIFPKDRLSELRTAPWDDHPNAEGHRIIANNLYEKLLPIINSM